MLFYLLKKTAVPPPPSQGCPATGKVQSAPTDLYFKFFTRPYVCQHHQLNWQSSSIHVSSNQSMLSRKLGSWFLHSM